MASIETQTKIGLLSNALILCGEQPLQSLSDERYGATVGVNLFELIYENELQSNRWRFAMKKRALSRLASSPLNEWQYAFQLPTDMLLPVGVYPRGTAYDIFGDHLYTQVSSVDFDYLFKPDINRVPAYFSQMLVYALYRDLVGPITENTTKVQIATGLYNVQRGRAMFADAQGRPNTPIADSPFTAVR